MNIRHFASADARRQALEQLKKVDLGGLAAPAGLDQAAVRNCENMIGAIAVPVGLAGPISVALLQSGKNSSVKLKNVFVPLATTEGALVASVSRGCKALGEVQASVTRVGATRGPVFFVENLAKQREFKRFLDTNFKELKKLAAKTSRHLALVSIQAQAVGHYHYVRFAYDTEEAMGMNMVTIATEAAARYIEQATGARLVAVAGNYDVDKKPSWLNFLSGRGMCVSVEAEVPARVLKQVLKVSAAQMVEVWQAKSLLGSIMSGTMGANAQVANVAAALFVATGQDVAQVGEASLAVTTCALAGRTKKDLYISIYLPDVMLGAVGGGTQLPAQRAALELLGIKSNGTGEQSTRLAAIFGAAALAGEVSLLASLVEGSLSRAHERLARGKKK